MELTITKNEKAIMQDAVKNRNGEIIEPANDDMKAMEIIVSLYSKHLVSLNFEKDKMFVSRLGRGVL